MPLFLPAMARKKDKVSIDTDTSYVITPDTFAALSKTDANKNKPADTKVVRLYSWNYKGALAYKENAGLDTSMVEFYINNPAQKQTIALQTLGNLGSPSQSAIFMQRTNKTDYIFLLARVFILSYFS